MLVDCDIHVGYHSLRDLLPYLDGATAELVARVGHQRAGHAVVPLVPPAGLAARRTPTTARRRPRARSSSARRSSACATSVLDPFDVTMRDPHARRGRGLRDPAQPAARRRAVPRLQRLAARRVARAGAAPARPARRHAAAPGGGRGGDPAARRARGDRRRVPARRRAHPVRQPRARSDLARLRRPRAPGRDPHPLRGRRHRRAGDRRRHARLLHGVPRAHRRRRCSATSPRSSATASSSASRARA